MIKRLVWSLLLIIILPIPSNAQYQPAPSTNWYTLETENFYVHYPKGFQDKAVYYGRLMEKIRTDLKRHFFYAPRLKTNLVLVDNWDILFGLTSFSLYNAIYYNPAQLPVGIGHYNDFDYNVLLHEYVHVIDMDMAGIHWEILNSLVGKIYSPNSMSPNWMSEGFATYLETRLTPGGRGRDPYYDMFKRMAFLEGKMKGVQTFDPTSGLWPSNEAPYIFGESIFRFMDSENQSEMMLPIEFRKSYSEHILPYFFKSDLRRFGGDRYKNFYGNWHSAQMRRYNIQDSVIKEKGVTPFEKITNIGQDIWGLTWGDNSNELYFVSQGFEAHTALLKLNLDDHSTKKMSNVNTVSPQLTFSKESNEIMLNEIDVFKKNSVKSFASKIDIKTQKKKKSSLTVGVISSVSDGEGGSFQIRYEDWITSIYQVHNDNNEDVLIQGNEAVYFGNLSLSPNKTKLAFDVWQKGGQKDIRYIDLKTNKVVKLTNDWAWDVSPSWSPDGRWVYFSSDRSGVYNIYAVKIATNKLVQITNVLSGAFQPQVSDDGSKLAFLSYSSEGFDVSLMDNPDVAALPTYSNPPIEGFYNPYENNQKHEDEMPDLAYSNKLGYNPFNTLVQNFRFPYLAIYDSTLEVGITFSGQDVLNRHFYNLGVWYNVNINEASYYLQYQNSFFYPDLVFYKERTVDPVWINADNSGFDSLRFAINKSTGLNVNLPFNKLDFATALTASYAYNQQLSYNEREALPASEDHGTYSDIGLGLAFSNAKSYKNSISTEEGMKLGLNFNRKLAHDDIGANFSLFQSGFTKYQRIPGTRHHVMYARLNYARVLSHNKDISYILSDSIRSFGQVQWDDNMFGTVLEYRLPLLNIEKGMRLAPFYLRKVFASFYGEYWNFNKDGADQIIGTYGAELHASTNMFYFIPLLFSVGYADVWEGPAVKNKIYFKMGVNLTLD